MVPARFISNRASSSAVRSCLIALIGGIFSAPPATPAERLTLEVRETAGIRRFGYPVEAQLRLEPPAPPGSRFRLVEPGGKPIPAQFRTIAESGGRVQVASLDFEVSLLPLETRKYQVEYGPEVDAGAEPGGLTLEEQGESYRIANGPHLVWEVPRDLSGLLSSVKSSAKGEFLRDGAGWLSLRGRDGTLRPLRSASPARIVKRGPLACRLRFEVETGMGGGEPVRSAVELEIPRSKSWVRVDWSLPDPRGEVAGLAAELHLRLEGDTAFADFGADSLVYAALAKGQGASLQARAPSWEVLRGPAGKLEPYVSGGVQGLRNVEGWAHLMDRERCSAVAVADFGKWSGDRIEVDQQGLLRISREGFTAERGGPASPERKSLRFWIHFVDFPPHLGAVTSPQSMAAPLEVKT